MHYGHRAFASGVVGSARRQPGAGPLSGCHCCSCWYALCSALCVKRCPCCRQASAVLCSTSELFFMSPGHVSGNVLCFVFCVCCMCNAAPSWHHPWAGSGLALSCDDAVQPPGPPCILSPHSELGLIRRCTLSAASSLCPWLHCSTPAGRQPAYVKIHIVNVCLHGPLQCSSV